MSKRGRKFTPASDDASIRVDVDDSDAGNNGDAGNVDSGASEGVTATVDPGAFVGDTADSGTTDAPARKRGRPKGSGTGTGSKAKAIPLNVTGLERLLVGMHGFLAMLSGRMEWALDTDARIFDGKTEAEFLAASIKDVSDHYGRGLLDQKTLDWINLLQCLGLVYGGRIFTIRSTPKPKPMKPATVQQTAQSFQPAPPSSVHRTPPPQNNFEGAPSTRSNIPGIGEIDLPDDHPLSPNNTKLN